MTMPNQSAAANRRPALQSDGAGNLAAIVAADRAFSAAVAELTRWTWIQPRACGERPLQTNETPVSNSVHHVLVAAVGSRR